MIKLFKIQISIKIKKFNVKSFELEYFMFKISLLNAHFPFLNNLNFYFVNVSFSFSRKSFLFDIHPKQFSPV